MTFSKHPLNKADNAWLFQQLKLSARSFYLTLKVLPSELREPIALAYLLARIADTISDHLEWPQNQRRSLLEDFRATVDQGRSDFYLEESVIQQLEAREKDILQDVPRALGLLKNAPAEDAQSIRHVVATLTSGMLWDLTTFTDSESPKCLDTEKNLDQYTYLVAGCVGEFWTQLSARKLPALHGWNLDLQKTRGINFGKALQLTNILRDIEKDFAIGRCYLPKSQLDETGAEAEDLLHPPLAEKLQSVPNFWLERAVENYQQGLLYFLEIPRTQIRLRLACLWPMLIGLKTLALLKQELHLHHRLSPVKISRSDVYTIIAKSLVAVWSNRLIKKWYTRLI